MMQISSDLSSLPYSCQTMNGTSQSLPPIEYFEKSPKANTTFLCPMNEFYPENYSFHYDLNYCPLPYDLDAHDKLMPLSSSSSSDYSFDYSMSEMASSPTLDFMFPTDSSSPAKASGDSLSTMASIMFPEDINIPGQCEEVRAVAGPALSSSSVSPHVKDPWIEVSTDSSDSYDITEERISSAMAVMLKFEKEIVQSTSAFQNFSEQDFKLCSEVFNELSKSGLKHLDIDQFKPREMLLWKSCLLEPLGIPNSHCLDDNIHHWNYVSLCRIFADHTARYIVSFVERWRKVNKLLKQIQRECQEYSYNPLEDFEKIEEENNLLQLSFEPEQWTPNEWQKWICWILHKFRLAYPEQVRYANENFPEICQKFQDVMNKNCKQYCNCFGEELGSVVYKEFQSWRSCMQKSKVKQQKKTKEIPKRHRKPRTIKGLYLWQLVLKLLLEPEQNRQAIRWIDRAEGEFEIIKSEEVSKRWGETKGNRGMNYEKMSRSLRQYYATGLLVKCPGRRLVYKFNMALPEVQAFVAKADRPTTDGSREQVIKQEKRYYADSLASIKQETPSLSDICDIVSHHR